MAYGRFIPLAATTTWAASGSINQDVSTQGTMTGIMLVQRCNITTGATPGAYNDLYDRIIASYNLSKAGYTFVNGTQPRLTYHHSRHMQGRASSRRPAGLAASQASIVLHVGTYLHFGLYPFKVNPQTGRRRWNPYDLSAGIPAGAAGSTLLTGTFGANNVMGSGYTFNSGELDAYAFVVYKRDGDPPEKYEPLLIPTFQYAAPTISGTTGAWGKSENIVGKHLLHSLTVLTTQGTNTPRSNIVLNSIKVTSKDGQDLVVIGGQSAANADVFAGELFSDLSLDGAFPADDPNLPGNFQGASTNFLDGVMGKWSEQGIYHFPMDIGINAGLGKQGLPLLDLRRDNDGDWKVWYGVNNATTANFYLLSRMYDVNPAHPDAGSF